MFILSITRVRNTLLLMLVFGGTAVFGSEKLMSEVECKAVFDRGQQALRILLKTTKNIKQKDLLRTSIASMRGHFVTGCQKLKKSELLALMSVNSTAVVSFRKLSGMDINVPEQPLYKSTATDKQVEIRLDANNRAKVQLKSKKGVKVIAVKGALTVAKMMETLKAVFETIPKGTGKRVIIRADAKSSHQSFVVIMDALNRLGIKKISVATGPVGRQVPARNK